MALARSDKHNPAKASAALPDCRFEEADIASWQPAVKQDVIFANASLQWIASHKQVFPHLAAQLAGGGVLAVQMPDNWQEPTHTLMRQVAEFQNYRRRTEQEKAQMVSFGKAMVVQQLLNVIDDFGALVVQKSLGLAEHGGLALTPLGEYPDGKRPACANRRAGKGDQQAAHGLLALLRLTARKQAQIFPVTFHVYGFQNSLGSQ